MKRFLHGSLLASAVCLMAATQAPGATEIVLDAVTTHGLIQKTAFGANSQYGEGFGGAEESPPPDPNATAAPIKPEFKAALASVGVGIVRFPGGTMGNLYRWKRGIGPLSGRTLMNVAGSLGSYTAHTNEFGPDEFGRLLEELAIEGVIVVNFATGNAQEAAEWVEYMNSPDDGGHPWAHQRALNGHPAPYNIKYWEVGNEYSSGNQSYWLHPIYKGAGGDGNPNYAPTYVNGGSADWETPDPVVTLEDFTDGASLGNGQPGQLKYVRYPPLDSSKPYHLYVNAVEWTRVETGQLQFAGPSEMTYEMDLDDWVGQIRFGSDGHGLYPPVGQQITLAYTSGPHDGFTTFYTTMKAVDPTITIYSGLHTEGFCQAIGNSFDYDGLQRHYYPDIPGMNSWDEYHDYLMTFPASGQGVYGDPIQTARINLATYGLQKAKYMTLSVSECDDPEVTWNSTPTPAPKTTDGDVWSQGMYYALYMPYMAEMGVPIVMKHLLNTAGTGNSRAKNRLLFRVDNDRIYALCTAGVVFRQLNMLKNKRLLASWVSGNPVGAASSLGNRSALQVVAARDPNDNDALYLLVANISRTQDITASVRPLGYVCQAIHYSQTKANHVYDNNGVGHPADITTTEGDIAGFGADGFSHTFPPLSVTLLKAAKHRLHSDAWRTQSDYSFPIPPGDTRWQFSGACAEAIPPSDPTYGTALRLMGGVGQPAVATLSFPEPQSSGLLRISANIMCVPRAKAFQITMEGDSGVVAGVGFSHDGDGLLDYTDGLGNWTSLNLPYYPNNWMKVDVIVDLQRGFYDVWLDDYKVFIGENRQTSTGNIGRIKFATGLNSGAVFYLDNVKVEKFNAEAAVSSWGRY